MLKRFALAFVFALLPSVSSAAICPILSLGSRGPVVSDIQKVLYTTYKNFPAPTGYYGATTEAAVKQWQSEDDIEQTGMVGPKTAAAMHVDLCGGIAKSSTSPSSSSNTENSKQSLIEALLSQVKVLQAKLAALRAGRVSTPVAVSARGGDPSTAGGASSNIPNSASSTSSVTSTPNPGSKSNIPNSTSSTPYATSTSTPSPGSNATLPPLTNVLQFCTDSRKNPFPSLGVDCPEAVQLFPDASSIAVPGRSYTDTVPDTLDLASWADDYVHGALAIMVPGTTVNASWRSGKDGMWVPDETYAYPLYFAYRALPRGGDNWKPDCGSAAGCINVTSVVQWPLALDSIMRASEISGAILSSDESARLLSSLRGVLKTDVAYSYVAHPNGDVPVANHGYMLMLLDDLFREFPNNARLQNTMAEYIRYFQAIGITDGSSFYWDNLPSPDNGYGTHVYQTMQQAFMGEAFANWYLATGNGIASMLSRQTANYLLNYGGGAFWTDASHSTPGSFIGHSLADIDALFAILSDARARYAADPSDPVARAEVRFVSTRYQFLKQRGDMGRLGNFGASSAAGVMLQIGVGLESFRLAYPDLVPLSTYYEDVERWVRNDIAEMRIDASVTPYIPNAATGDPVSDRLQRRAYGNFLSDSSHIFSIPLFDLFDDDDGIWVMRGVYDVWDHAVELQRINGLEVAWINITLNTASPYLDVKNDFPYRGRVEIDMHHDIGGIQEVAVRIPSWGVVSTQVYRLTNGQLTPLIKGTDWSWNDRYVAIYPAQADAQYLITYTIPVAHNTVTQVVPQSQHWDENIYPPQEVDAPYTGTFLGDLLVHGDSVPSDGVPRYLEYSALYANISGTTYKETAPPTKTVRRFVPQSAIQPVPSVTYNAPTPTPSPSQGCAFGDKTIASGASVTAYQSASVPSGSQCVSENRTCSNGTLSGSYQNASCSVRAAIPVDVFLVAGQSNAQGAGDKSQSPAVSNSVLQFYGGQLLSGADPVGNAATGSAWPAFGNAYIAATGRSIVFVPTAHGGTCQSAACSVAGSSHPDNWDTSGALVDASVTALQNALTALRSSGYDPTLKGILWSQGEADAVVIQTGGENFQTYRNALSNMIARYRSQFPSVPLYIFRTGAVPGGDDVTVRSAQEQIASSDPFTKIVFRGALNFGSQGLLQTDGLHYIQQGYNLMGQTGGQNVAASRSDGSDTDTPVLGLAVNGDYNGIAIAHGGSYTLSWATFDFASCALNYNSSIGQGSGSIPIAGSTSGSSSTGLVGTYTLACTTAAGKQISTTVTIAQQ